MPYVRLRTGSAPVPARSHFVAAFCRPPRAPSWWPAGPTPTNRARGACSWSPHVTGTWAAPAPRRTRARVAALSPVTTSTFVVVRRVCLHGPLSWCVLLGAARTGRARRTRAFAVTRAGPARGRLVPACTQCWHALRSQRPEKRRHGQCSRGLRCVQHRVRWQGWQCMMLQRMRSASLCENGGSWRRRGRSR